MSFIEWSDRFSVGVDSVDHEHRELIELIAGFQREIELDQSVDAKLLYLGEALALILAHFALEEKLMRDAAYDAYEEHKADHERLVDQLRDIMDAVEDGDDVDNEALSAMLEEWFAGHFRTHDARLHGRLG
jgi:hemerythrin-like metal-binding protein